MSTHSFSLASRYPWTAPEMILKHDWARGRSEVVATTDQLMIDTMIEAAIELAQHGFKLIPVRKGSNEPPLLSDWRNQGTSERWELTGWRYSFEEGFNLGVVTGAASNLFVLDVDGPNHGVDGAASLARLECLHDPLPVTAEARTPGGGRHIYFRLPAGRRIRNSAGRLGVGLDVRGEGGYIVAPPSYRPDGRYVWTRSPSEVGVSEAPDWLVDLLDPPRRRRPRRRMVPSSTAACQSARQRLDRARARVAFAREGTRNDTLNAQMYHMLKDVDQGLLSVEEVAMELANAALSCGLDLPEIKATLASAMRGRAHHG
jgi:hypothetical protein